MYRESLWVEIWRLDWSESFLGLVDVNNGRNWYAFVFAQWIDEFMPLVNYKFLNFFGVCIDNRVLSKLTMVLTQVVWVRTFSLTARIGSTFELLFLFHRRYLWLCLAVLKASDWMTYRCRVWVIQYLGARHLFLFVICLATIDFNHKAQNLPFRSANYYFVRFRVEIAAIKLSIIEVVFKQ